MTVNVKTLDIDENGIEFEVRDASGHFGDFFLTSTKLIWCKGRTQRQNGKEISWEDFSDYMMNK